MSPCCPEGEGLERLAADLSVREAESISKFLGPSMADASYRAEAFRKLAVHLATHRATHGGE